MVTDEITQNALLAAQSRIAELENENLVLQRAGLTYAIILALISVLVIAMILIIAQYNKKKKQLQKLIETHGQKDLLTRTSLRAQEEERRHVYTELEENLSGLMHEVDDHMHMLGNLLNGNAAAEEEFQTTIQLGTACLENIERIIQNAAPPVIVPELFEQSLQNLCKTTTRYEKTKCAIAVEKGIDFSWLSVAQRLYCYRIIQKALSNVAKYAEAENCAVTVYKETPSNGKELLVFQVRDDGKGFNPETPGGAINNRSLIYDMTSRAEAMRADLTITPGKTGMVMRLAVPLH